MKRTGLFVTLINIIALIFPTPGVSEERDHWEIWLAATWDRQEYMYSGVIYSRSLETMHSKRLQHTDEFLEYCGSLFGEGCDILDRIHYDSKYFSREAAEQLLMEAPRRYTRTDWVPGRESEGEIPQPEVKARPNGPLPDIFGAKSRNSMAAWMERNRVPQDGDVATTLALVIQTALALQDLNPGPRDGMVGPKTIAAIVAWQAMTGFSEGASLADVFAGILRAALVLQGFEPGPASGMLGPGALDVAAGWEYRFSSEFGSPPSKGKDRWGALAFSRSANGWSAGAGTDQPSQAHAVARALAGCRESKRGDNCAQVLVWKNQCGAIAVGDGSQYGAAAGSTKQQAERNALRECAAVTSSCNVRSKLSTCMPARDDFERQGLSDFRVKVSSTDRRVQVCVRDHECEDGDRIRVSVNGVQIFAGEIRNWWACRSVAVRSGPNPISMLAVNGTGYKGEDCSHNDVNTGEIRVTGTTSVTQSWKHRGGAGSDARIVVHVDE